jgi:hypothetical protein
MTSNAVATRDPSTVQLFPGSADNVLELAADVASKFSDIVKQQRMSTRIGTSDHINVEAWQTIGAMTGVSATEASGVQEMEWRRIPPEPWDEPEYPGTEPRGSHQSDAYRQWKSAKDKREAWELGRDMHLAYKMGRAFGFTCTMRATKNGVELGWGQGMIDRTEANWVNKPDTALQAMVQTRAISRTLSVPLKWTVKLAGYEPTPVEEMDGTAPAAADPQLEQQLAEAEAQLTRSKARELAFADEQSYLDAAAAAQAVRPDLDGMGLVATIVKGFKYEEGLPEVAARTLRIFRYWAAQAESGNELAQAPANTAAPAARPADDPPEQVTDAEVIP